MIKLELEQLGHYDKLFVGFSGGLDSTVLLHVLTMEPKLAKKLVAVHINHGLSTNALDWQNHCHQFCKELGILFISKQVEFPKKANIEEEARKARYNVFASLLRANDCLILAHHLDDQAETLLLQLFRGAGVDGLAAMPVIKSFAKGALYRPFLKFSRENLEAYAEALQLRWVDDESNLNEVFSRNYLRQKILPLIGRRWPAVATNLARTSNHCQQAQSNLEDLAKIDCPALHQPSTRLVFSALIGLGRERIANVLRFWLKSNQVKMPDSLNFNRLITEVIESKIDAKPEIVWKDFRVRRYQQTLYLEKKQETSLTPLSWTSFPESIAIEGLGQLDLRKAKRGLILPKQSEIEIRFRQGGELFNWHGQTKQLKKLLQNWQIPPWLRGRIPLLYVNGQLAVIVGYAISDHFYGDLVSDSPLELVLTVDPIIK